MLGLVSPFLGIIAGVFTYALIHVWVEPIIRFNKARFQIDYDLMFYANKRGHLKTEYPSDEAKQRHLEEVNEAKKAHRKNAHSLRASYNHLPRIYQVYPTYKQIYSKEASKELVGFSNT